MSTLRRRAIEGLKVGDRFQVSRSFCEKDVERFADFSRDYNPVHFDGRFARVKNLKGPVCHGLLVASLVTEIGGQLGWFASGMSFCFKRPVYLKETVECTVTIRSIDPKGRAEAQIVIHNQEGEAVLEGTLSGYLPGEPEKAVMRAMIEEGDPTNKLAGT